MKKEYFDRHPVHQLIGEALRELKDIAKGSAKGLLDLDEQIEQLSYLEWSIDATDPALMHERILDQIQARLSSLIDYIRVSPFRASLDPESAEFVSFQADLLGYISQAIDIYPYPRVAKVSSKEASGTISDFKSQSRSALNSIRQMAAANQDSLKKELSALAGEIEREKKALKVQTDQVANLQQSVASYQANMASQAAAKATEFDALIVERQGQLAAWSSEVESQGSAYLAKIQAYYNLTTDTTLAGRFVQASREERTSYWINLSASVIFFVVAIALVIWETRWPANGVFSTLSDPLYRWLGKISLVAVCVIPASVFASQATKHRRAQTWYRTVGVRIATLKPYLSEFTGNYEAELKDILKSFFTSDLNADGPKNHKTPMGLQDLEGVVGTIDKIRAMFIK